MVGMGMLSLSAMVAAVNSGSFGEKAFNIAMVFCKELMEDKAQQSMFAYILSYNDNL
jgi:hypothetical protein